MIPNKSNFKFQELTPITGVKPYVIRYWETEFEEIAPVNGDSGQKLYARKDVEAILKIKHLLFEEKLTIPEAKVQIKKLDTLPIEEKSSLSQQKSSETSHVVAALEESLKLIQTIKFKRNW